MVSSYTPSVLALLQKRNTNSTQPRILAVSQKSSVSGLPELPNVTQEIEQSCQRATTTRVELVIAEDKGATVSHVLEEMTKCSWVHLACHGTQDIRNPTKSAFALAGGNLELAEIIKHRLPHAELAFLSACQTATGDLKLAEEAVHLAAGMMFAGYGSVVATMWAILDKDGPVIADRVYAELLNGERADSSRAAHALHHAVQQLRLSGAPFLAWMPFIHIGA